jgi:thiamine-monophosphate kinase
VTSIAEGLNKGAHEFGAYIIGGDTGEASDLVVSVTLFGLGEKESIPLRSGAKPDDIIAVTGKFGKTSAGLKILLSNCISSPNMRRSLINSVLYPNARLKEGIALTKSRSVSASIDSSDGLAWSLYELSQASNVGFVIDDLPAADEAMSFAKLNKLDIVELTLYGGEEYELVLTIKPDLWKKAVEIVEKVGGRLLNIGRITKTKKMILKTYSREIFVEPRGYEHFRN